MPSSEPPPQIAHLRREAEECGLAWRGAFHPLPDDGVPPFDDGTAVQTVVLLGTVGHSQWAAFASSPERSDGADDPLDRWSRRVISAPAATCDGVALFPFQGPPWLPFQQWARRAECLQASPLGILIHPQYGLWHAYRGALGLRRRVALTARATGRRPCDSCPDKPCLTACPVGTQYRHTRSRAEFHMRALVSHAGDGRPIRPRQSP